MKSRKITNFSSKHSTGRNPNFFKKHRIHENSKNRKNPQITRIFKKTAADEKMLIMADLGLSCRLWMGWMGCVNFFPLKAFIASISSVKR